MLSRKTTPQISRAVTTLFYTIRIDIETSYLVKEQKTLKLYHFWAKMSTVFHQFFVFLHYMFMSIIWGISFAIIRAANIATFVGNEQCIVLDDTLAHKRINL